jgi:hypothetical protein
MTVTPESQRGDFLTRRPHLFAAAIPICSEFKATSTNNAVDENL